MKKEHGGKTYVTVPAQVDGSCQGCAAQHDSGLCDKLHTDENGMFTPNICVLVDKIFKEQTMSEQKEKTALELVDEIIACPGCPSIKHLTCLKSAIERERDAMMADIQRLQVAIGQNQAEFDRAIQEMNDRLKSAITMRPISELPDKVPDGCAIVLVSETCAFAVYENPASYPGWQGFYIIPFPPKAERKLHPCYMPGCGGSVTSINGVEKTDWRMMCTKCGMLGPIFNTKAKAELEWGHAE